MRPVPAGDEPFEQLTQSLDARRDGPALQVAMDELTDAVADAVRFRVVDGLAYGDVAARLGCSEAAPSAGSPRSFTSVRPTRSTTDVHSTGGRSMSTNTTYVDRLEHELLDAIARRRRKRTVVTRLAAMTIATTAVVGVLLLTRNGSSPALASDIKGRLSENSEDVAFVVSSPEPSYWRLTALGRLRRHDVDIARRHPRRERDAADASSRGWTPRRSRRRSRSRVWAAGGCRRRSHRSGW